MPTKTKDLASEIENTLRSLHGLIEKLPQKTRNQALGTMGRLQPDLLAAKAEQARRSDPLRRLAQGEATLDDLRSELLRRRW